MMSRNTVFFLWLISVGGFLFLIFALKNGSLLGAAVGGVVAVTATWVGAKQMHGVHHHYHHQYEGRQGGYYDAAPPSFPLQPSQPSPASPFGAMTDAEATVTRRYIVREKAEVVFVPADLPPELRALFAGGRQSAPPSRPITALQPEVRFQAIPAGHQADIQPMPVLTVGGVARTLLLGPPKQKVPR